MKTLTYLPVNWVNGLKLTSQHFFANQYCQTEALNREAGRSLTSYNYGLGEVLEGIGDNLEIEISGDTMSTLCVRLKAATLSPKAVCPSFITTVYTGMRNLVQPFQNPVCKPRIASIWY